MRKRVCQEFWSPRNYIEACRIQTAERLLRETGLRVWEIGDLVGYDSIGTFSRAFERCNGQRPGAFRKEQQDSAIQPSQAELASPQLLQRAMAGKLDPERAEVLIRALRGLYPAPEPDPTPSFPMSSSLLEEGLAEAVWKSLAGLPPEQQLQGIRQVLFPTPALFQLLLQQSREEGRRDRQRGVALAELALESLRSTTDSPNTSLEILLPRAWAWLGNARRLALDFDGAERAFTEAESAWATWGQVDRPDIEGELYDLKSALRAFQRRLDEALTLSNRAVKLLSQTNKPLLLVRALLHRAHVHGYAGKPQHALPDITEALRHLDVEQEPYMVLSAYTTLGTYGLDAGLISEAAAMLPAARELCQRINHRLAENQLIWIEARMELAAGRWRPSERLLALARSGFLTQGETVHAALVSLDLAMLYEHHGQPERTLSLAMETIPVFERLRIHREAAAALRLLHRAAQQERLTRSVLQQLRSYLSCLPPTPDPG